MLGHSSSQSLEGRMNQEADYYGSLSQQVAGKIPIFFLPTFYMNEYTFFRDRDGFIESNISYFIDAYSAIFTIRDLMLRRSYRMLMSGLNANPHPPIRTLKLCLLIPDQPG